MKYPADVWGQIRNLSCDDLMNALEKDGWTKDETRGSIKV
jgi:predicted RNA binding protein YcfA (HicA-like mRNA interferase family)